MVAFARRGELVIGRAHAGLEEDRGSTSKNCCIEGSEGCFSNALTAPTILKAILCSATLIAVIGLTKGFVFDTYDDAAIQYALAGYRTGSPYGTLTYVSPLLGWLIAGLYCLQPAVPWYGLFQITILAISITVINYALLVKVSKIVPITPINIVIVFLIDVVCFAWYTHRMQFTISAAALGTAAIALILAYSDVRRAGRGKYLWVVSISAVLLMLICYAYRKPTCIALIPFWMLAILFVATRERALYASMNHDEEASTGKGFFRALQQTDKEIMVIVAATLLGIGAIQCVNNCYKAQDTEYYEYDAARLAYQDYTEDRAYGKNIQLYETAGWDQEATELIYRFVYLLPEMNTDDLNAIVDAFGSEAWASGPIKILEEHGLSIIPKVINSVKSFVLGSREAKAYAAMAFGTAAVAFTFTVCWRGKYSEYLRKLRNHCVVFELIAVAVFVLQVGYLAAINRLLLRAFCAVAIPCLIAILLVLLTYCAEANPPKLVKSKRGPNMSVALLLTCLMVLLVGSGQWIIRELNEPYWSQIERKSISQMADFDAYAMSHPDNFYIYDFSLAATDYAYDPFVVYVSSKPTNTMISGGNYTYSPCYYEQLEFNNMNSLSLKNLLNKNVQFVSDSESIQSALPQLMEYMESRYGVNCNEIDRIGNTGATVYAFN